MKIIIFTPENIAIQPETEFEKSYISEIEARAIINGKRLIISGEIDNGIINIYFDYKKKI
jgi:hypothetical protein